MTDASNQRDFSIPVRPRRITLYDDADENEEAVGTTLAGHTDFYFEPQDDADAEELTSVVSDILNTEGDYEYSETDPSYFLVVDTEGEYSMFHVIVEPESGLGPYVLVNCREATTEASVERFWNRLNKRGEFDVEKNVTRNVDEDALDE